MIQNSLLHFTVLSLHNSQMLPTAALTGQLEHLIKALTERLEHLIIVDVNS